MNFFSFIYSSQKTYSTHCPLRKNASTSLSVWCNTQTHTSWMSNARDVIRSPRCFRTPRESLSAPGARQSFANPQEDVQSSLKVRELLETKIFTNFVNFSIHNFRLQLPQEAILSDQPSSSSDGAEIFVRKHQSERIKKFQWNLSENSVKFSVGKSNLFSQITIKSSS